MRYYVDVRKSDKPGPVMVEPIATSQAVLVREADGTKWALATFEVIGVGLHCGICDIEMRPGVVAWFSTNATRALCFDHLRIMHSGVFN